MISAGTMRQEIERLAREFEDAYRRRDFRAVADFYTEDAKLMPSRAGYFKCGKLVTISVRSSLG